MNPKETLELKNTVTEMKNVFDGLISRPNTDEGKKISELEDISIENSETEKQREKEPVKNRREY